MSAPNLILAFDIANHRLVSFRGSSTDLTLRQSRYSARIYIVTPSATSNFGQTTYSAISFSQYNGLRAGIWSGSTGTLGDANALLLAIADELAWALTTDSGGVQCYEGIFDCNTAAVATFIGSASYASGYFAVNLVLGTDLVSVFDHNGTANVVINASTDTYS